MRLEDPWSLHPPPPPLLTQCLKLMNRTRSAISSFSTEPYLPCRKLQWYLGRPAGSNVIHTHRHGGSRPSSAARSSLHPSMRHPKHQARLGDEDRFTRRSCCDRGRICSPGAWQLPACAVRLSRFTLPELSPAPSPPAQVRHPVFAFPGSPRSFSHTAALHFIVGVH